LFVSEAIGFTHLTKDFGFAEELRIETGGNAEEMTDRGAVVMLIEEAAEDVGPNRMKFAEEGGKAGGGFVGSFRRDAVELAAIAGGENQGFFEKAAGTEFVGGAASLFESEGDALANVEWRRAMI
jgi:hypothetical protein